MKKHLIVTTNFFWVWASLFTEAQLRQCSWLCDKWEKISQFGLVVSSRSTVPQINECLPQVWQQIFLNHSWEICQDCSNHQKQQESSLQPPLPNFGKRWPWSRIFFFKPPAPHSSSILSPVLQLDMFSYLTADKPNTFPSAVVHIDLCGMSHF